MPSDSETRVPRGFPIHRLVNTRFGAVYVHLAPWAGRGPLPAAWIVNRG